MFHLRLTNEEHAELLYLTQLEWQNRIDEGHDRYVHVAALFFACAPSEIDPEQRKFVKAWILNNAHFIYDATTRLH